MSFVVDASPNAIQIESTTSAVLVVDMQNDFASEGGMFHTAGIDLSMIRAVVAPTASVLRAARSAAIPVVYLRMEFRPDLSDIGTPDSPNRIKHEMFGVRTSPHASEGQRFLIRDTWNTSIISELAPEPGDVIVSKQRFSGFHGTDLDTVLRTLGVRTLVFTGCTTSVCVESTLRDAFFRDYRPVLLSDCTAEPLGSEFSRTNHEATLMLVERLFGWVSDSHAFVRALEPATVAAGAAS